MSNTNTPVWDLTQLVKDEKEIVGIQSEIEKRTQNFTNQRMELEERPFQGIVSNLMNELEKIGKLSSKLYDYAFLQYAENMQNENAKALESNISMFLTEQGNKKIFFGLWWKNLEEEKAKTLLPDNPDHQYYLNTMHRFKAHILSEKEEQLVNIKDLTGSEALFRLYELHTGEFTYNWEMDGKTIDLSEDEVTNYARSPLAEQRVKSYEMRWQKYGANNGILGEIYKYMVLDIWNEHIGMRKYSRPISIRNISNQLSDEIVDTFLSVCQKNTGIFQDYLEWKAQKLNNPYSRYHIYAPFHAVEKTYTFDEGYKLVMDCFDSFSPAFKRQAHRVLKEKRLHARIQRGKRGGAFCLGVPGETSYVLLNWGGKFRDITTLAHELGHAVHHHMAEKHSLFTHDAPLPLAETASTFGEILVMEKLYAEEKEKSMQQYLLAQQIDDAYSSIQRQAYFCLFEQDAFNAIREGKTIPEIHELYYDNLRDQFGKKMEIPENAKYEWMMIDHLYDIPFYVYAYAFGQLLVLALYEKYQKEGKDFVPQFEKFLSHGGSMEPEQMLNEIGFDPTQKQSWQKGFDLLKEKFQTLQKMEK